MKKRKKALTPIQKVRFELKETKAEMQAKIDRLVREVREEREAKIEFHATLNILSNLLGGPSISRFDRHDRLEFGQIPFVVQDLLSYKRRTEGAVVPEREHNNQLLEIIRWQINPKAAKVTADLKDIEEYRRRFGPLTR